MPLTANDGQLVSRLQGGDLEALGILYERYKARVYRTALAITRDTASAEDLLQDTFLRLHRYAQHIDTSLPLEPWLYRVTVNLAYTRETRKNRWQTPLEGVIDKLTSPSRHNPEWQTEMNELQARVMSAIASLKFNQRTVLVLYYLNSLSLKEISFILDCPEGTVKSRLHYARENLLQKLGTGRQATQEMVYEFI